MEINPPVDPEAMNRIIGTEELPENENTLLNIQNDGDPELLADRMLNSDRITDRAGNRGGPSRGPSGSWDTNNPTMRRIGS